MFLGIEIGGTKLQLGVGTAKGPPLAELLRLDVEGRQGAEGIRRQIEQAVRQLAARHAIQAIGFGFGGPVDRDRGRVIDSHQVEGWKEFPLVEWAQETFHLPAILTNDSDIAGLAEARIGAGKGQSVVFYSNVGSGIGGAFVIDGQLYWGGQGVASEIGHLRPGLDADRPDLDVESIASGWAIARWVRGRLEDRETRRHGVTETRREVDELLERCAGRVETLDTKMIGDAARTGNKLALAALERATTTIGWALAQMITLLAPNIIVMGGGVSLVGEELFFEPLRRSVRRYVFPPLADGFQIVPAQLGEEVVVHGALALIAERAAASTRTAGRSLPPALDE